MTDNPQGIKEKLAKLQDAITNPSQQTTNQTPPHRIQRAAHYLRDREHFTKHYSPMVVAIGPIHHRDTKLKQGDKYKRMWAAKYLERTDQDPETVYKKIKVKIGELKTLFTEDAIDGFDDHDLSWMLFVDGCSLLQILDQSHEPEEMNVKVDQLVFVHRDVFLLENQLPYQMLKLLSCHGNESKLLESMDNFLQCNHLWPADKPINIAKENNKKTEHKLVIQPPAHLLDRLRSTMLHDSHPPKPDSADQKQKCFGFIMKDKEAENKVSRIITHRNIQELKAAGIKVKKSETTSLRDIKFISGNWFSAELKLPKINVDDGAAPTFLNLTAYEMCPDFENDYEICTYVAFMDSLIDHTDDVKELRSAGVLDNALGSDEEVASLFNTISTDLVHDMGMYGDIRNNMEKHYRDIRKTWVAQARQKYFSNPWSFFAFLAALIALVLTSIQTWYAIWPAS